MTTIIQRPGFYVKVNCIEVFSDEDRAEYIINKICKVSEIPRPQLIAKTRKREILQWRQLAAYLICKSTSLPLRSIGLKLGGREHSNTIHSRDFVNDMLEIKDKQYLFMLNKYNQTK